MRASEELVAGKADDVGAGLENLPDGFFMGQTPPPQVVETPGALIDDQRQVVFVCETRQFRRRGGGGESDDPEVGLVGDEDRSGLVRDRRAVILEMGPVGAADLDEPAPRGFHDLGETEGSADLDQLGTGNDDVPARSKRRKDQQERPGVVVDHHRALSTADTGDAILQG